MLVLMLISNMIMSNVNASPLIPVLAGSGLLTKAGVLAISTMLIAAGWKFATEDACRAYANKFIKTCSNEIKQIALDFASSMINSGIKLVAMPLAVYQAMRDYGKLEVYEQTGLSGASEVMLVDGTAFIYLSDGLEYPVLVDTSSDTIYSYYMQNNNSIQILESIYAVKIYDSIGDTARIELWKNGVNITEDFSLGGSKYLQTRRTKKFVNMFLELVIGTGVMLKIHYFTTETNESTLTIGVIDSSWPLKQGYTISYEDNGDMALGVPILKTDVTSIITDYTYNPDYDYNPNVSDDEQKKEIGFPPDFGKILNKEAVDIIGVPFPEEGAGGIDIPWLPDLPWFDSISQFVSGIYQKIIDLDRTVNGLVDRIADKTIQLVVPADMTIVQTNVQAIQQAYADKFPFSIAVGIIQMFQVEDGGLNYPQIGYTMQDFNGGQKYYVVWDFGEGNAKIASDWLRGILTLALWFSLALGFYKLSSRGVRA